jgi:dynein heavy chain, axonemal
VANLQGNLLDDAGLVDVLAATKASSEEVSRNLLIASSTRAKIDEACEEFRPVAARAALMYFLICSFSAINCMYQVSKQMHMQTAHRDVPTGNYPCA